jgi:hypothetical protein
LSGSRQITAFARALLDEPHRLREARERPHHRELDRAREAELRRGVAEPAEVVGEARPLRVVAHRQRVLRAERRAELQRRRKRTDIGGGLEVEAVEVEHRETGVVERAAERAHERRVPEHRVERQPGGSVDAQPDAVVAGRRGRADELERRGVGERGRRKEEPSARHCCPSPPSGRDGDRRHATRPDGCGTLPGRHRGGSIE